MALVLLLSFEKGKDLGVGDGECAGEDGLVEFVGDSVLVVLGLLGLDVLKLRVLRGLRDRSLGFVLPLSLSEDMRESGGLVLILRFDIEGDLGAHVGPVGVPASAFLGDRDLPGRAKIEPRPSNSFCF